MKIVACVKAVPSTTEVKMDPKTNTIVRDGKQSVINPFDTAALELGIQLKERLGGTLCAISMGIPDTVRLLRDAVSRGADDALLLSDRAFAGADTLATSYALSLGIERLAGDAAASEQAGADLTRCGLNGSPTQVVRSFVPEHGSGAVEVAGSSDEQADALMAIFEEAVR